MSLLRKLLVLPPLVVGVGVVIFFVKGRQGPAREEAAEISRAVRVVTVEKRDVVPRVIGYGTVRPARTWSAVAEIAGRVAEVSPLLNEGEVVPAGHTILRIDDTDAKLEVARLRADADGLRAQLAKLDLTQQNVETLLAVEKRSLDLAERELERLDSLGKRGSATAAEVDAQRRVLLQQRTAVVNHENRLRLLPSERDQLKAQLKATEARLARAQRDVERAVLVTPFPCRIETANVEATQSVTVGQTLATAYDIRVAEVEARIALGQARHLFHPEARRHVLQNMAAGVDWSQFGVEATVRLRLPGQAFERKGRFARAAPSLAPGTRAIGIVVAVDQPYEGAVPSKSPPLIKGMFMEVELSGRPYRERIVVPRAAVRAGRVYVAGVENRLVIRPVTVEFVQGEEAILASGLVAGERLVVSDLIPAIEGMLLAPLPVDASR
ncbi:MAG: efflux RND transporter periplasmic adaptor subunit [Planctomycetota bacterium]